MVRKIFGAWLAFACGVSGTFGLPAAEPPWEVFVLVGQSNMDGRGQVAELSSNQVASARGSLIYYRNFKVASAGWEPLRGGFSVPPGYRGGLPAPTFGPELGFVARLRQEHPLARFALLKATRGGTSLERDWRPGRPGEPATMGPCFSNFLHAVREGTELLRQRGEPFVLRGILWHQGESDAADSVDVYQAKLSSLIQRMREDLREPRLPFVVGEVYDNGKRDGVRQAQRAVAQQMPGVFFASAENLNTWDKGTHFDASSQWQLGERMAGAWHQGTLKIKP